MSIDSFKDPIPTQLRGPTGCPDPILRLLFTTRTRHCCGDPATRPGEILLSTSAAVGPSTGVEDGDVVKGELF